jgi:hypothetical protein
MTLVNKFWDIIRVELDHTPKREIVPHDLFHKCVNIKKL